jgi:hypothetical protein
MYDLNGNVLISIITKIIENYVVQKLANLSDEGLEYYPLDT